LLIDAENAHKQGIKFYHGNEKVWLADFIPAKYISKM
jgi:putative RNA 2'-phosphotransferase